MTEQIDVTYIHPRSSSLSHVYAISDIIDARIAITKNPWQFANFLLALRSRKVVVLAGNLDFVATSVMCLLTFFPGRFILLISSHRTNFLHKFLVNLFVKVKMARIAFITEHSRGQLAKAVGEHILGASAVVHHSSGTADLALDTVASMYWNDRKYDVLFFGRLDVNRGLPEFLTMAEQLPHLTFAVAGSGPFTDRVTETAARLDNLHFLGFVSDRLHKLDLLSNAKILFSNMRETENFGISIVEAVAAGAAVSCPRDYGPVTILGPESPYLRDSNIETQKKIEHLERLLASGPIPHDVHRFHSGEIRKRWCELLSTRN